MNVKMLINQWQYSQQAILVTNIALAVVFCAGFLYAAQTWVADWQLAHETVAPVKMIDTNEKENVFVALQNHHLFGQSPSDKSMALSNAQMKVTGIIKYDDDDRSKALISTAGAPSKIYGVGDNLPYGVSIHDITADAVILQHDSIFEKLPLTREKLDFKPKPESTAIENPS